MTRKISARLYTENLFVDSDQVFQGPKPVIEPNIRAIPAIGPYHRDLFFFEEDIDTVLTTGTDYGSIKICDLAPNSIVVSYSQFVIGFTLTGSQTVVTAATFSAGSTPAVDNTLSGTASDLVSVNSSFQTGSIPPGGNAKTELTNLPFGNAGGNPIYLNFAVATPGASTTITIDAAFSWYQTLYYDGGSINSPTTSGVSVLSDGPVNYLTLPEKLKEVNRPV